MGPLVSTVPFFQGPCQDVLMHGGIPLSPLFWDPPIPIAWLILFQLGHVPKMAVP